MCVFLDLAAPASLAGRVSTLAGAGCWDFEQLQIQGLARLTCWRVKDRYTKTKNRLSKGKEDQNVLSLQLRFLIHGHI